jgi:protein-S-isoprenylcysteine O-methyltransferase Ste14
VLVALTGQLIRLVTIGYEYIERGGKAGKVYASRLVQGGVYALTRNPMYLGNGLIAIGMTMVAGAPFLYLVVLPLFLYIYHAIIAAEEAYLRWQFGADYERYCAAVNRLLPALRHTRRVLAPLSYDWRQAVRKDLSTMAGLFLGLILLPILRRLWLEGWEVVRQDVPQVAAAVLVVLGLYGVAVTLKRQRKVFYQSEA